MLSVERLFTCWGTRLFWREAVASVLRLMIGTVPRYNNHHLKAPILLQPAVISSSPPVCT